MIERASGRKKGRKGKIKKRGHTRKKKKKLTDLKNNAIFNTNK